jgi:hypothetical protein
MISSANPDDWRAVYQNCDHYTPQQETLFETFTRWQKALLAEGLEVPGQMMARLALGGTDMTMLRTIVAAIKWSRDPQRPSAYSPLAPALPGSLWVIERVRDGALMHTPVDEELLPGCHPLPPSLYRRVGPGPGLPVHTEPDNANCYAQRVALVCGEEFRPCEVPWEDFLDWALGALWLVWYCRSDPPILVPSESLMREVREIQAKLAEIN